ncbi:hypothetical protein [Thermococcus celer]|uniref:Bacterial Pleckstrin homology domain-containing protein n=1 Tax=Thermococcus celer Vu 13 = JCM 8558 TaxID=1293037 RepID=A0A218P066_THECE|nr:hypothetical protein [Thermococcus celer]ASI98328.1 hypothetical protein A3L02_01465 [Thermococcus celer Vu 13 = JCM 8558]
MGRLKTLSIAFLGIGIISLILAFLKGEVALYIVGALLLMFFLITPYDVQLRGDRLIVKHPLITRKYKVIETIPVSVFSIAKARKFGMRIGNICIGYFSTREGQDAFFATTQSSALLVRTEKGLFVIDNPSK